MAEKIIQNPSITSGSFTIDDGKIVAIAGMPLAGSGGGTQSDFVYVPSFNDETGDISFILGVTGTEGKGPWHISGTPGPKGEDGAQGEPGNDACPITATSAEVDDGVHVTISYTSGGNALTEFDILDGYDGNDGKTPEFSANPVNAHLLWKYSGDSNWTDFGFAMSGEKGPQGETGPRGLSGADGKEGPAGYSPQVTTASVNNDATHNNGGTEISITYKDDDSILTAKYTAWNGNNGEGATIALNGKDGIAISNNGSNYYAGLSADYLTAVQSVSSKLTKTSADTLYQAKGDYVTSSSQVITGEKQYALTTAGWAEVQAGTSFTGVTTTGSISGGGVNNDTIGLLTSAENALTAVGNKVDKPSTTLNNKYLVLRTNNDGSVSGWVDFNDNVYSKTEADGRYVATADVGTGLYYSGSTPKLGVAWSALSGNIINSAKSANSAEYITNGTGYSGFNDISAKFGTLSSYVPYSATVLPIGTSNTATNNSIAIGTSNTANDLGFAVGQANTALKRSIAFGVNNYANDISLAIGYENSASGNNDNNQSAVNIAIGYANSAADHAAAFINVCTAQNYAFAAGHANSAVDNSVAFGRNTSAYFYSFDFGHSNYVKNYSYAFGRGLSYEGQWASGSQYGAFVIGGWNATTSYATTADAPLFIVGNGSNNNPSDGFIVYRDGDVTAAGKISANGMFAVSTEATLFGQSRIANVGDTTALGTNWLGVTQSHQGFLKYVNGGNVGDLNGTSIQINFAPDGANSYGNITVNSQNNESKIINVPTASYNNMTTFDPTNGPNYMLRKTASGFDIGAKVVNVTSMPQNLDANTYYFVYEV